MSDEDGYQWTSGSIINQQQILEEYAKKNGFENIRHFAYDGLNGFRFDRPNFVKMMDEVAAGNVGTVIAKDLSRFGRDHLRAGLYMESFNAKAA